MSATHLHPARDERSRRLLGRPMSPALAARLHRASLIWAALAILVIEISRRARWFGHPPGEQTSELAARPYFLILFAIGTLLALRWELVGGSIAAFAASGLAVWSLHQLELAPALFVIGVLAVPGAIWAVLDLHDHRATVAVAGFLVVGLAVGAGAVTAARVYDHLFGPTHPESTATVPDGTVVEWIWSGGVTTTSATVVARLRDDGATTATALVAESDAFREPTEVRATPDEHGIVRFSLDGLNPGTEYHVAIVPGADPDASALVDEARFRTFALDPESIRIALGSCARVGSNGAVFDAIRATDADLFINDGDLHYANIDRPDIGLFREILDHTLSRPGQSALYRDTPIAYVWDDHEYGDNNGDRTSPTRGTAQDVYREYVPSYPLADDEGPIYQAFDLGPARVIMTDVRSERTPSDRSDDVDKTMLGAEQRAWLEHELESANGRYPLIIWVNPAPWIGEPVAGADGWAGYSTERRAIADFIAEHRIRGLLMLSGDAHMVAIDDGTNSDYSSTGGAAFPVLHAAALDRPGHTKGGPYSHGVIPGGGQFGTVDVVDLGDRLRVTLTGRDWTGATLLSYEYEVDVGA